MLRADLPLAAKDISSMSRRLGVSIGRFVAKYCTYQLYTSRRGRQTVEIPSFALSVPASGRCVFLRDSNQCSMQEAKPSICARSPFVSYVAHGDGSAWEEALSYCPGIGTGEFFGRERIEQLLAEEATSEREDLVSVQQQFARSQGIFRELLPTPIRVELAAIGDEDSTASEPRTALGARSNRDASEV